MLAQHKSRNGAAARAAREESAPFSRGAGNLGEKKHNVTLISTIVAVAGVLILLLLQVSTALRHSYVTVRGSGNL
jgi:hypothetical protein